MMHSVCKSNGGQMEVCIVRTTDHRKGTKKEGYGGTNRPDLVDLSLNATLYRILWRRGRPYENIGGKLYTTPTKQNRKRTD